MEKKEIFYRLNPILDRLKERDSVEDRQELARLIMLFKLKDEPIISGIFKEYLKAFAEYHVETDNQVKQLLAPRLNDWITFLKIGLELFAE